MNPASVLLLRVEDGLAGACWGLLIRDGDVSVDRRNNCRQIRNRRVLSECRREEGRQEGEKEEHDRTRMFDAWRMGWDGGEGSEEEVRIWC